MNNGDINSIMAMVQPILYVIGAYIVFSIVRSIFKSQKENKNQTKK